LLEYVIFGVLLSGVGWLVISENPYPRFLVDSDESKNLIVFVGKKITLEKQPGRYGINDTMSKAHYRVLQVIHGQHTGETIEFKALDHWGIARFGKYDTVLLYVVMRRSWLLQPRYFHEKYMAQPVYNTADGKWAGCVPPGYLEDIKKHNIQTEPANFQPEVIIDVAKIPAIDRPKYYPHEFYEYRNNSLVCRRGLTIEKLFQIEREGTLKARGVFK
jgi:hypothetical protein